MTEQELREIIAIEENYRIELTTSTGDMDKFQEAICAFANDMPGSRKKGYLLIGVRNNGQIDGLKVDDALQKKISGIRSDGNILPLPVMSTEKVVTENGDVLVVEVTPSFDTPVRYRGRTFIRIGPRREICVRETGTGNRGGHTMGRGLRGDWHGAGEPCRAWRDHSARRNGGRRVPRRDVSGRGLCR